MLTSLSLRAEIEADSQTKITAFNTLYAKIMIVELVDSKCEYLNDNDHAVLSKMKETLDEQKGVYGFQTGEETSLSRDVVVHASFTGFYDKAIEVSEKYTCNNETDLFVNDMSLNTAKLLRTWGVPIY